MIKKALAFTALAAACTIPATAQNIFGEPNSGSITLEAGFPEDPTTVDVISGGSIDVSDVIDGCVGHISEDPDVRLTFNASGSPDALPLYIYATSGEDTTLLINAPDGNYYCNDDGADGGENGTNPSIVFGPTQSGDYEIWVGSYDEGEFHEAQVGISELSGQ